MKTTSGTFERDTEFDLQRYWRDFSAGFEQKVACESEPCTVRLRVHPEWLWMVTNDMAGRYTILDTLEDNWVYLEVAFGTTYSAIGRMWGLAQYGEVLEPEWLREELLAKAKALLTHYS
jgi:predicted DNA-binding transcriptional regulator YafY